jgi:phosphatidylinositol glycan class V
MLWLMFRSGLTPFRLRSNHQEQDGDAALQRRLAVPQLAVAALAVTSFHVQIVNRISSGYPLWYMHLARGVGKDEVGARRWVRAMAIYSLVQGALFAAFLPPA